jgi:hypothetical protein
VPDRVPDPGAARAGLWAALAVVSWLGVAGPSAAPSSFGPVESQGSCRLGVTGTGPACPCDALDARTRLVLGLAVPLDALGERDFEALSGIGPARAAAIEAERRRAGPYRSPRDLAERVPGIGPGLAERIASQLAGQPGAACDTPSRR